MKTASNSRVLRTIPLLIAVCLVTFPVQAKYGGGSGTAENPYQIWTAEQMNAMGVELNDWYKHFKLMADVDLSGIARSTAVIPVFAGSFDGNGFTVRGLTVSGVSYLGLFGEIKAGGTVRNLGVTDVSVGGTGQAIGGLVGLNYGTVTNCYSTGTINKGYQHVGGLVGKSYNQKEGGGTIYARIANCYSTARVNGDLNVGGLVGQSLCNLTNCYSAGAVSGRVRVGGLVGDGRGGAANCYSTGTVSGYEYVGGLMGYNRGNVSNCFWDVEISGIAYSYGGAGLTTAQMMDLQMYALSIGWSGNPNWILDSGNDYPRLAWEGTPGELIPQPTFELDWLDGAGTVDDPYEVLDTGQFVLIGAASALWDRHFVLMGDIDLSDITWSEAVIPEFAGSFNGNGFTIRGLTISGGSHLGLFGKIQSGAEVYDLGVLDVNVAGTAYQMGGLVGYNDGSVTNCYSTGSVSGFRYVGGLVGISDGNVTNCYSTATASADLKVGGIVGWNRSNLSDCYSTGTVTGNGEVGGLVGDNSGSISNSYSTGTVSDDEYIGGLVGHNSGNVTYSFWDMDTSGQTQSSGGTGKTTTEMKTPNTFSQWFVCVGESGWTIDAGNDYPRLWWEEIAGQALFTERLSDFLLGTGTLDQPYLIFTRDDIDRIGMSFCDQDWHFKLMADVDLSGISWTGAVIPEFSKTFNGNGHVIRNLTITGEASHAGLFGKIESDALVYDLGVVDANIADQGDYVGALAGENEGAVSRCFTSGIVSGHSNVGGLAALLAALCQGIRTWVAWWVATTGR